MSESLNDVRNDLLRQVSDAMRQAQYHRELVEEYRKLSDFIKSREPDRPLAGAAQMNVMTFCATMIDEHQEAVKLRETNVTALRSQIP